MKYTHTIFYVDDVSSTIEFFQKAFGLQKRIITESGEYGELLTGGVFLAFASKSIADRAFTKNGYIPSSLQNAPLGVEITLETDDVDKAFEKALSEGAILSTPPADMPWGQRLARVRDINGIIVELCSPMN